MQKTIEVCSALCFSLTNHVESFYCLKDSTFISSLLRFCGCVQLCSPLEGADDLFF